MVHVDIHVLNRTKRDLEKQVCCPSVRDDDDDGVGESFVRSSWKWRRIIRMSLGVQRHPCFSKPLNDKEKERESLLKC